jgi:hypothetical protein
MLAGRFPATPSPVQVLPARCWDTLVVFLLTKIRVLIPREYQEGLIDAIPLLRVLA